MPHVLRNFGLAATLVCLSLANCAPTPTTASAYTPSLITLSPVSQQQNILDTFIYAMSNISDARMEWLSDADAQKLAEQQALPQDRASAKGTPTVKITFPPDISGILVRCYKQMQAGNTNVEKALDALFAGRNTPDVTLLPDGAVALSLADANEFLIHQRRLGQPNPITIKDWQQIVERLIAFQKGTPPELAEAMATGSTASRPASAHRPATRAPTVPAF